MIWIYTGGTQNPKGQIRQIHVGVGKIATSSTIILQVRSL